MKKFLIGLAASAVTAVGIGAGLQMRSAKLLPPAMNCVTTSADGGDFRLLIVGESWAAGGRFFPELSDGLSKRIGKNIRACALGFSGRNTRLIVQGIQHEYPMPKILTELGGRPDAVIIMNGVNDVIQHVGSRNYGADTASLAALFEQSAVLVVSLPRVNEVNPRISLPSNIKRHMQAFWHDGGMIEANDLYRKELAVSHPEIRQVEFDRFIPSYRNHEEKFEPDGIHLTPAAFKSYGLFLAEQISTD